MMVFTAELLRVGVLAHPPQLELGRPLQHPHQQDWPNIATCTQINRPSPHLSEADSLANSFSREKVCIFVLCTNAAS
jgi:hypothetical protein